MKACIGRWWQGPTWCARSRCVGERLYATLVGGTQIGASTLIRFYAWHLFGLTLVLIIIGVWHIFKVRRDGGIAVPPPELRTDLTRITARSSPAGKDWRCYGRALVLIVLSILVPAPLAPGIQEGSDPSQ